MAAEVRPVEPGPAPDGRLIDTGSVTYHVIELGAGPPTVFLHGGGPGCDAWTDFGAVAPLFAAERRCHLVDLLQHGRSDKCPIGGPMWDVHARTLVELLDALGLDRVDLVCNSWGGSAALAVAAGHPDRVRSIVATGSMPVFTGALAPPPAAGRRGREARDRYFGGDGPSWDKMKDLMADLEFHDRAAIPDATVTRRFQNSIDPGEMALTASSDTPRGERQDLTSELGRIRCSVLFLWGMHDAFLPPEYALGLARLVDRGQLYVMDRTSHHPQEERPEHYHRIVRGFLDQDERREVGR